MVYDGEQHWNTNLVHTVVGVEEVEKVLKTFVFETVQVDKIVWKFEKNDMYLFIVSIVIA